MAHADSRELDFCVGAIVLNAEIHVLPDVDRIRTDLDVEVMHFLAVCMDFNLTVYCLD